MIERKLYSKEILRASTISVLLKQASFRLCILFFSCRQKQREYFEWSSEIQALWFLLPSRKEVTSALIVLRHRALRVFTFSCRSAGRTRVDRALQIAEEADEGKSTVRNPVYTELCFLTYTD